MIDLNHLIALPRTHRITIPPDYLDEMGHMNIMYYIHIFDRAAWTLFDGFGMSLELAQTQRIGMFALEQHIRYMAEVHAGQTVSVHSRVLGVSVKRVHFMHFMVNETTDQLAATLEVLGSCANLDTRRTAPLPDSAHKMISDRVRAEEILAWAAPTCGILQA